MHSPAVEGANDPSRSTLLGCGPRSEASRAASREAGRGRRLPGVPRFADYLSLGFWAATAFSPTDVSAVKRWAKLLMIVEACVSLGIAGAGDLPRGQHLEVAGPEEGRVHGRSADVVSISRAAIGNPGYFRVAGIRQKTVSQSVGECPCRLQVVVLDIGRRYLHPEVAFAVFP